MVQQVAQRTGNAGRVLPLSTQPSLFIELEGPTEMSVDELRFRLDSEKLRERGLNRNLTKSELRQLAAESLVMTFKAMAGRDGATDFQKQKSQNEAIAKCMTGDFEGLLEAVGINTDAFLDQVRLTFPDDTPRAALVKFANLIYERYQNIKVEDEETRFRDRVTKYDDTITRADQEKIKNSN